MYLSFAEVTVRDGVIILKFAGQIVRVIEPFDGFSDFVRVFPEWWGNLWGFHVLGVEA